MTSAPPVPGDATERAGSHRFLEVREIGVGPPVALARGRPTSGTMEHGEVAMVVSIPTRSPMLHMK